jgi:hypothetical protein
LSEQYPVPPWLAPKMPWPPVVNGLHRELFIGNHAEIFEEHYKRLKQKPEAPKDFSPRTIVELMLHLKKYHEETYHQEINLPQALALLWADLIAGKPGRYSPGATDKNDTAETDTPEEIALQRLTENLQGELQEAVAEQSYAGDGVLVVRLDPDSQEARIVAYPSDQWIPWSVNNDPKNITAHVIVLAENDPVNQTEQILTVEVHYKGLVRYRRCRVGGGEIIAELPPVLPKGATEEQKDQVLPRVTEFLVQPIRNFGTSKSFRGISDYNAIHTLVAEFDVRASQWGALSDRFTAPIMTGPSSALERDENGTWQYKTAPDGKYIPRDDKDDPEPKYLVWDPAWQMQSETWDRLMGAWYQATGTTPAAFSVFKEGEGGSLSGTALRLRMTRPIQVAGRKRGQVLPATKRALLAAQQLETTVGGQTYKPTMPAAEMDDNLPADPKEAADIEATRKREGLTTVADSLMRMDGLSEAEAHEKAQEIADEQAANLPAGGLFMPGANLGLNGPGSSGGAPAGGQGAA